MRIFWLWSKRFAAAASESLLPLLGIGAYLIGVLAQNGAATLHVLPLTFFVLAAIFFVLWPLQTWFGYVRKTHDPKWVLDYQKTWDSPDGYRRRHNAAVTIKKLQLHLADLDGHREELSEIDDALDMLEDIGFYVLGEQISPETAHHHFYWWRQGYWCCAHEYITAMQTKRCDPTRWQNIKPLFEITSRIELRRAKRNLKPRDLCMSGSQKAEFLAAETGLPLSEQCRDQESDGAP